MNLRLEAGVMTQGAWDYLAMHKFGAVSILMSFCQLGQPLFNKHEISLKIIFVKIYKNVQPILL